MLIQYVLEVLPPTKIQNRGCERAFGSWAFVDVNFVLSMATLARLCLPDAKQLFAGGTNHTAHAVAADEHAEQCTSSDMI